MARAAVSTSFNVVSVFPALAGLTSTATRVAAGTSSRRSSSRFAANSAEKIDPVRLPPGRARLATRPSLTGSSLTMKTMGIVVVAALAANAAGASDRDDHGDLSANQFGRQLRQPINLIFGPAVFDRHVLALDIAVSFRPWRNPRKRSAFARQAMRRRGTRSPASPAAARAPPAATPPRRRAADELAPSHHSITSSARASSVGGTSRPSIRAV